MRFFSLFMLSCLSVFPLTSFADMREFEVNAVEQDHVKRWLPNLFTVKKGDTLVFHLKNKIEGLNSIHGFAIKEYGVEVLVDQKGLVIPKDAKIQEKDVKFIADKVGTFEIRCHLHPAHVGGKLVVLE